MEVTTQDDSLNINESSKLSIVNNSSIAHVALWPLSKLEDTKEESDDDSVIFRNLYARIQEQKKVEAKDKTPKKTDMEYFQERMSRFDSNYYEKIFSGLESNDPMEYQR